MVKLKLIIVFKCDDNLITDGRDATPPVTHLIYMLITHHTHTHAHAETHAHVETHIQKLNNREDMRKIQVTAPKLGKQRNFALIIYTIIRICTEVCLD